MDKQILLIVPNIIWMETMYTSCRNRGIKNLKKLPENKTVYKI